TISDAVCPSQNIVDADCERTPEAILHVDNQLVLVEATRRLKLKKIFIAKGAHTTICHARHESPRQRSIDGPAAQQVARTRIDIADCQREVMGQLAFNAYHRLKRIGSSKTFR